jgi:hypothetical protein
MAAIATWHFCAKVIACQQQSANRAAKPAHANPRKVANVENVAVVAVATG